MEIELKQDKRKRMESLAKIAAIAEEMKKSTYRDPTEISNESQLRIESAFNADLDSILAEEEVFEGKKSQRFSNCYERNPKLRTKAIEFHGFKCKARGFDFEEKYGECGSEFIEVHHLKPVSSFDGETRVNSETEMTIVCSNCHRMIHRNKNDVLSLDNLRMIISAHK